MTDALPVPGRRVAVVGTTGSGKTTVARQLAGQLGCPHIELDALYWGPDWTPAPRERFRQAVEQALAGDTWTVDGNYSVVRDLVLGRADTLVWLNYPLPVVLWHLLRRTLRRVVTGEELWNSNREHLRAQLSRDSLFLWALRTHRRRKREYRAIQVSPDYAHLAVIHLCSTRAADRWLAACWTRDPAGGCAGPHV